MKNTFWLFGIALLLAGQLIHAATILALFPFPGKSHAIMLNSILSELLNRGHELDVMTGFPLPDDHPNLTTIAVTPHLNFWSEIQDVIKLPSIFEMNDMSHANVQIMHDILGNCTTNYALQHPDVQRQLIHNPNPKHYDVVLVEQFYQEAFLMLAHQFNAPVVSISTFGSTSYFHDMFGSFGAWSHVPNDYMALPERMTFWQRVQNVHRLIVDKLWRTQSLMAHQQQLADRYFSHLPENRPSLAELNQRIAIVLKNSYVPFSVVQPTVPTMIDVGGLHIQQPGKLPANIQTFLDGATDGAIFFSLGTQVPSSQMPDAQLRAFLSVFGQLHKQRILWKWESEDGQHLFSDNMMVQKWMPQNEILAHPNVRVFITHGGLLGAQEAVWYGVPVLGIPFFADQHRNVYRAQLMGYGLSLSFANCTETALSWALNELLHNPSYQTRAKWASQIFRDRPEPPIERAMYWIEYVARFGGAEHLRSAGLELSWASYFLLDILGVGLVALLAAFWIVRRAIRMVVRCGSVAERKQKVKVTNKRL